MFLISFMITIHNHSQYLEVDQREDITDPASLSSAFLWKTWNDIKQRLSAFSHLESRRIIKEGLRHNLNNPSALEQHLTSVF